jgi:Glycogen recognition site of AMP-activated protein kinase
LGELVIPNSLVGEKARRLRRCCRVRVLALCLLLASPALAGSEPATTAWSAFFESSQLDAIGALDNLAPRTPTIDLPLAVRAIERWESLGDTTWTGAYPAFARWHFWMGEHWDRNHNGLWGIDPLWTPGSHGQLREASATLSSMQLVQLEALALLARRRDFIFDSLVWWTERRRLSRHLARRLYDPIRGAYTDLDSTANPTSAVDLGALLPLAFGAPHIATRSLEFSRDYWRGPDTDAAMNFVLDRAKAIAASEDRSHLFDSQRVASLATAAIDALYDRRLARELRDALAHVGLSAGDSLDVASTIHPLKLSTEDLVPSEADEVARALTAVEFLRRGGFIGRESFVRLEATLDSLRTERLRFDDASIEILTDALVTWRATTGAAERSAWDLRRSGLTPVDPEGTIFHFSDSDATHWIDRALDLLTEVVIHHAVRSRPSSKLRARLDPEVRGTGDATRLVLQVPIALRETPPADTSLLWTDGLQVLSPIALQWTRIEGGFEATVPTVPQSTGLWQAILTGLPGGPRQAPTLAVVEPVVAEVVALTPNRERHTHRIRLRSQVNYSVRGTIEVEAPVLWSVDPSARVTYALGPRETRMLDIRLIPDPEASPGHYPVQWHFYDGQRELRSQSTEAARPFRWVSVGPLDGNIDDQTPPRGVLIIDFSQSLRGRDGPVRWRRLPLSTLGPHAELRLGGRTPGLYYALTAFTTGSRDGRLVIETLAPFVAYVNGEAVLRSGETRGRAEAPLELRQGVNHVLIGTMQPGPEALDCLVRLEAIEGGPLRGVDDSLELMLDGFAYVQSDGARAPDSDDFARNTLRLIPISYSNSTAARVSVVGTFNAWAPDRTPMARDEDGRWVAGIRVPPGRFEYKFAVDGQHWIADPANPMATPDGFGGKNSVLIVD